LSVCPNCGSEHTRRGGMRIWGVYLVVIALGVPAVVVFHLHAGIVAAIMLVAVVLANVLFAQRVCLDCGHQWKI
jgi:cobalamin biosynthesis protein CobD/CbiB